MNKLELKKLIKEEADKILVPRRSGEERKETAKSRGIEIEQDRLDNITTSEMMENMAHMEKLVQAKDRIIYLAEDWIREGFEVEDIIEYWSEWITDKLAGHI